MKKWLCLLLVLTMTGLGAVAAAEEKPTLRILGQNVTFDLINSPMIPLLEKATGYKVEYEALPAGDEAATKLLMLLASGTGYDLCILPAGLFDTAVASNAVQPLDELLAGTENIRKLVPETSDSWDRVVGEDGHTYGIPQKLPIVPRLQANQYRADLLDALGLDTPTTLDEFYEMLVAVKSAYPDMIPYAPGYEGTSQLLEIAFGIDEGWQTLEDGTILPNILTDGYRDYIAFLNKLYVEGLLDIEFPTNNATVRLGKFTSGKAFMITFDGSEGPGFFSALETNVPGAECALLPFIADASGNKTGESVASGLEKVAFIPKSSKHAQDAIQWVDAFAANFKDLYIGPEGVDHEIVEGKYRPIMPNFTVHDTVWWFMPLVDEANVTDWWQARIRKSAEVERGYGSVFALQDADDALVIVNSPFTMLPPNEEFTKLGNKLGTYIADEMVKLIAGSRPMSDYDAIIEKWKADGGTRYVEFANELLGK